MYSTIYSKKEYLVLQIIPEFGIEMQVNINKAYCMNSNIFIPKLPDNSFIICPLDYFQEHASILEKWIKNDSNKIQRLDSIDNLKEIILTEKKENEENILFLPNNYGARLLDYFKLDIYHNLKLFEGFDCYAFVSLLANVKYNKENPEFDYKEAEPKEGDIIVLTNKEFFSKESIKHWALYLGNGYYISKFGRSGEGPKSFIHIMNLEGMKTLYESNFIYVAIPKINAGVWDGYKLIK